MTTSMNTKIADNRGYIIYTNKYNAMNAREIVRNFNRQDNLSRVYNLIMRKYGPEVAPWLRLNFDDTITNFSAIISKEMSDSDLVGIYDMDDYVAHYNAQYISSISQLLDEYMPEKIPYYSVTDGEPTASSDYNMSADDLLASWMKNAGRARGYRDDKHGERGIKQQVYSGHELHNRQHPIRGVPRTADRPDVYTGRLPPLTERFGNPETAGPIDIYNSHLRPPIYHSQSTVGSGLANVYSGGITFCDQSNINTNSHHEQLFGSSYNIAMNRENVTMPHTSTPFGASTAAATERLMSRTDVFGKSSINGEVNGIPFYRRAIQRRGGLDRDATETLDTTEYDCDIRGYNMSSLIKRTRHKQAARHRADGPDFAMIDRSMDRLRRRV